MRRLLAKNPKVKLGDRYERLVAIGMPFRVRAKRKKTTHVVCRCDCGTVRVLCCAAWGKTVSCGCFRREVTANLKLTHGKRRHPLHQVWSSMKRRCGNPNARDFYRYGGRGISVCQEWSDSFDEFYNWAIRAGYKQGLELDREDNDGNYEPGNCRWVTHRTNTRNSTTATQITAFGETKAIYEWANDPRCQVKYGTLVCRLNKKSEKWTPERAISEPPRCSSRC